MRVAALLLCLLASPALADQFLGIEAAQPEAAKADAAKPEAPPKATAATGAAAGSVHGNAVVGGNRGEFSGHLGVGYYFNRFMSLDLIGEYLSYQLPSSEGEQWGPELDAVLHLANPLPVTPFVGAGPGYIEWRRVYGGEAFDKGHAATASVFGGLQIRFTRFFGLQAQRRRLRYLETAPVGFDDRKTREASSRVYDQIGFVVMF